MSMPRVRLKEILVVTALVIILYFGLAYGIYNNLTQHIVGANDFYSRWVGARALFMHGVNPYSDAVTQEIQIGMSGRLSRPDEDQLAFAYPLYSAFIAAPLVALPYPQAQAYWMAFLILGVMGASLALTQCFQIEQPAVLTLLLLGTLFFYPSVRAIFLGQYAIVSFLFLGLAIWSIHARFDIAAGVFLALVTVKPQPAVLLVPTIIVWAAWHRCWRIVTAALALMIALVLAALMFVPTWPLDFVQAVRKYTEYEPVGPPIQIAVEWLVPKEWRMPFLAVSILALVGWMGWRVVRTVDASWSDFYPTLYLAAIITTLGAGRVGSSDQVLLLIPWFGWLSEWVRSGRYVQVTLAALVLLILPWAIFLATLRGNAENVGVSLVLPFLSLVVYVWHTDIAAQVKTAESI